MAFDFIFPFTDPRGKVPALAETAYVQREVDPDLRVMWDGQREKYVVLDTRAPGGPNASYVMVVQEPDGSFRPFDGRTIETLRKLRHGHDRVKAEIDKMAAERERANDRRRQDVAESMAQDFRHFGQQVTPSAAWRDRTDPAARERIRKLAGL